MEIGRVIYHIVKEFLISNSERYLWSLDLSLHTPDTNLIPSTFKSYTLNNKLCYWREKIQKKIEVNIYQISV